MYFPQSLTFPNADFRETLSHESAHFMKKHVVAKGPDDEVNIIGAGFSRYGKHLNNIYEESNAEFFSLFCADDNIVHRTPYGEQLSFTIALLKRFSQVKGIESVDAFKKLFKANAIRDFSFQRELVEVFGTETVKAFNNFSWWEQSMSSFNSNTSESGMTPERLAELGGFNEEFTALRAATKRGEEISLPGLKGTFKASNR